MHLGADIRVIPIHTLSVWSYDCYMVDAGIQAGGFHNHGGKVVVEQISPTFPNEVIVGPEIDLDGLVVRRLQMVDDARPCVTACCAASATGFGEGAGMDSREYRSRVF